LANAHILILGGARSGKTALAENICLKLGENPAYIATAQALDSEMDKRILLHKEQRGNNFTTYEEPLNLAKAIENAAKNHKIILVDCLTLWLSNLKFSNKSNMEESIEKLKTTLKKTTQSRIILVSNEVGMGIVPNNQLAREFGDESGLLHQQLAEICQNVYLCVAGLPLALKGKLVDL